MWEKKRTAWYLSVLGVFCAALFVLTPTALWLVFPGVVQAQEKGSFAPHNPFYEEYMAQREAAKAAGIPTVVKEPVTGRPLGGVPQRIDRRYLSKLKSLAPVIKSAEVPEIAGPPETGISMRTRQIPTGNVPTVEAAVGATSYPTSFDLRNYKSQNWLTPIKDQSNCGSCWAHAAIAGIESWFQPALYNFSEDDLVNSHGFDWGPCDGGLDAMAIAYFARKGVVSSIQQSYEYLDATQPLPPANSSAYMGFPYAMHLTDIHMISTDPQSPTTSIKNIKSMLYSLLDGYLPGMPVSIGFFVNDYFYDSTYAAYFCPIATSSNHAVAIVGWDDNYPASVRATPVSWPTDNKGKLINGAWIVRNSWGVGWGGKCCINNDCSSYPSTNPIDSGGYFWMSYYDQSIDTASFVYYPQAWPTKTPKPPTWWSPPWYSWTYQYDPLGEVEDYGFGSTTAWMANVFKGNSQGAYISAVGFYSESPGTTFTVYIYDNVKTSPPSTEFSPIVHPTQGTLKLTHSGSSSTAGYHVIPIPKTKITAGENFSVVVKVTSPGYNYPIALETAASGYSTRAYAIQGQSYISSNGTTWYDLDELVIYNGTPAPMKACLKAFGNKS
ncbi:MAG TPA: lectin like domain-containing protein [Syntrophobacteraceae bacterium]|nr:lectin like domain-containing protein [Syntrophobacteraceae bacterium]